MRMLAVSLRVLLLGFLFSAAHASDTPTPTLDETLFAQPNLGSNSARFARGLPPSPPRRLFDPTRVRRQQESPSPAISGYIAVYSAGVLRGYLAPGPAATPTVTSQLSNAAVFQYTKPTGSTEYTPVALEVPATTTGRKYLALSGNGVPGLLTATSANSVRFLLVTTLQPAGYPPQRDSTSSATYDETTIFLIDPTTNAIKVRFTNYNGTNPPSPPGGIVQQGAYLYFTSSTSRFIPLASGSVEVTLEFIPIS
ncbi:hypothetical protein MKEN_00574900 [Mycena kentingensis (nom. inval.)]|nr:hypothetical protein MKEN_00574900 [Mycena kentingensis (nom. inval.)]